jgi:NAD(P)H-hydrate epimerase
MAGISVLRVGAGLSTVATAESVLSTVAGFHPEVMTEPLPETAEGSIALSGLNAIQALAKVKSVIAIGPGISRVPETSQLVRDLVKNAHEPIVLDADGLNAFEGKAEELKSREHPIVITPHPGEMARLLGSTVPAVQRDRINVAQTFAREHNVIVVLKGHRTLVASPDGDIWINATGNPGMATGGTGDILTGMVSGMIAQHRDQIFEAVVAAVYLHGLAGDIACEHLGEHSLIATDLLTYLPQAFDRTRKGTSAAVEIFG